MQLCTNGVAAKKLLDQLGVLQEDDHKNILLAKKLALHTPRVHGCTM